VSPRQMVQQLTIIILSKPVFGYWLRKSIKLYPSAGTERNGKMLKNDAEQVLGKFLYERHIIMCIKVAPLGMNMAV